MVSLSVAEWLVVLIVLRFALGALYIGVQLILAVIQLLKRPSQHQYLPNPRALPAKL